MMRAARLSATCALKALRLGWAAPDTRILQQWGVVVVGFVIFTRPTSVRLIRRCDISFNPTEVTLQMNNFKYGERGSSPRIPVHILFPSRPDPLYDLLWKLADAATFPDAYLFPGQSCS